MNKRIRAFLTEKILEHRERRKLQVLVCVLIAAAVALTLYLLKKPAVALTSEGEPVHYHTKDCYDWETDPKDWENYLYCNADVLGIHKHTSECFDRDEDGNQVLTCGKADYVIHQHVSECYDREGNVICGLAECQLLDPDGGYVHYHTVECYLPGSYRYETATASNAETIAKATVSSVENAAKATTSNADTYYRLSGCLICGLEGADTQDLSVLDDDELMPEEVELIDDIHHQPVQHRTAPKEGILHEHDDGCYEDGERICGLLQTQEHVHGPECFIKFPPLICEESGVHLFEQEDADIESGLVGEELDEDELNAMASVVSLEDEYGIALTSLEDEYGIALTSLEDEESGSETTVRTDARSSAVSTGIDFTNWITGLTIMHRTGSSGSWEDLGDDAVSSGEEIRFKATYIIPGGKLDYENRTITYHIPSQLGEAVQPDEGIVYNDAGQEVGTYIISGSQIAITFNDRYVQKNMNGQAIEGFIAFTASVDKIQTDTDGNLDLNFKDDLTVNLIVDNGSHKSSDLTVQKSYSDMNEETGTLTYTITVSSENGTGGEVTLHDVMSKVSLNGTIEAPDAINITRTNTGFDMTIPAMNANSSYTITYEAKFDELPENGTVTGKNTVSVESMDQNGKTIKDSQDVYTTLTKTLLKKSGTKSEDGKTITWQIVAGGDGQNLKGYTIKDDYAYTMTDLSATAHEKEIADFYFPYTFTEDTYGPVVITYTTPASAELGDSSIRNTVSLEKGVNTTSSSAAVGIGGYAANPLNKTAGGIESQDGSKVILNWKAEIDLGKITDNQIIPDTLTYKDELLTYQANQYFSWKQLAAVRENLNKNYPDLEFKIVGLDSSGNEKELGQNDNWNNAAVSALRITFTGISSYLKDTSHNRVIAFTYQSTGETKGTAVDFWNSGMLNDKWTMTSQAKNSWKPIIEKRDAGTNSNKDSFHGYYDKALEGDTATAEDGSKTTDHGILKWDILLTLPEKPDGTQSEAVTVVEKLPEEVSLYGLTLQTGAGQQTVDISGWEESVSGSKAWSSTAVISGCTVTVCSADDGDIESGIAKKGDLLIKIPQELASKLSGSSMTIHIEAKIRDSVWENSGTKVETAAITNAVTVKKENGSELGSSSQTQTVAKDEYYNVISKDAAASQGGYFDNNIITYQVDINPDGIDMIPGKGTDESGNDRDHLTVKDSLLWWSSASSPASVMLVPDSVKVYRRNEDGSKGTLIDCPYTYSPDNVFFANGDGTKYEQKLEVTIPDETPLILEYQYKFNGAVGNNGIGPTNTASLCWEGGSKTSASVNCYLIINDSNAGANINGITLYKHDAANAGTALSGAEFKLYRYDAEKKEYLEVKKTDGSELIFRTDEDGTAAIYDPQQSASDTTRSLAANVAYKLAEVTAPSGYLLNPDPLYFYVHGGTDHTEVIKPSDFNGFAVYGGDVLYFSDEKIPTTSITINKQWMTKAGTQITDRTGAVRFLLYQVEKEADSASSGNGSASSEKSGVTITIEGNQSYEKPKSIQLSNAKIGDTIKISIPASWKYPEISSLQGVEVISGKTVEKVYSGEWIITSSEIQLKYNDTIKNIYDPEISVVQQINTDGAASSEDNGEEADITKTSTEEDPPEGTLYGEYIISDQTGWTWTRSDLPAAGTDAAGNRAAYQYYVREVSNDNCTVSYDPEDSISSGTITMTNTVDEVYRLPETGKSGTLPYTTGGFLLLMTAGTALMYKQKRGKEDS
jgi:hypothetical protein